MAKFQSWQFKKGEMTVNLQIDDNEKSEQNKKDLVDCLTQAAAEISKEIK